MMHVANKNAQYGAYHKAAHTVAKTKQVVMLYDGAIRNLQQAREAISERRIQDRYNLLSKASEIVLGLQGCIDFENGGDVATTLFDFYSSVDSRIISIHRSNSIETCDQLIKELKEMREAWNEIDRKLVEDKAAETLQGASQQAEMAEGGQPLASAGYTSITVSA